MIEGLEATILSGLDPADVVTVYEGDAEPDAYTPSVWVTDGGLSLSNRRLCDRAGVVTDRALLVCSNTSALGVTRLARDVAMALDGSRHGGGVLRVVLVSEAIEDREDPTEYCWTSTVDVMLTTSR